MIRVHARFTAFSSFISNIPIQSVFISILFWHSTTPRGYTSLLQNYKLPTNKDKLTSWILSTVPHVAKNVSLDNLSFALCMDSNKHIKSSIKSISYAYMLVSTCKHHWFAMIACLISQTDRLIAQNVSAWTACNFCIWNHSMLPDKISLLHGSYFEQLQCVCLLFITMYISDISSSDVSVALQGSWSDLILYHALHKK